MATLATTPLSLESSHPSRALLPLTSPLPTPSPSLDTDHTSRNDSPPGLYVTFKVLQLVKGFCRRAKKAPSRKPIRKQVRRDFEREAYEEIDRYLGRKSKYPVRSGRRLQRSRAGCSEVASPRGIGELLLEIDDSVSDRQHSLNTIASNEKTFLRRAASKFKVKRLSLKRISHLLAAVTDLIDNLQHPLQPNICDQLGVGEENNNLSSDPTYLANLEHLLLCLLDQLLRQAASLCVDLVNKHIEDCQKDQSKHSVVWFFEFPDARHPLSTTWPWSIKPSLAVIWGVCWMFNTYNGIEFDKYYNIVDNQGHIRVPRARVQAYLQTVYANIQQQYQQQHQQERRASAQSLQTQHMQQQQQQQGWQQRQGAGFAGQNVTTQPPPPRAPLSQSPMAGPVAVSALHGHPHGHPQFQATLPTFQANSPSQAEPHHHHLSPAGDLILNTQQQHQVYSNAWTPAAPTSYAASSGSLPQATGIAHSDLRLGDNAYTGYNWVQQQNATLSPQLQLQQQQHFYNGSLNSATALLPPHLQRQYSHNPNTPLINIDTASMTDTAGLQQPQDPNLHSASSNGSYQYPHDTPQYNNNNHHPSPQNLGFNMGEPQDPPRVPVSPVSAHGNGSHHHTPREVSLEPPQNGNRKRSFGEMSQSNGVNLNQFPTNPYDPQLPDSPSRRASETSLGGAFQQHHPSDGGGYDDASPGKPSRTLKRGNPPINEHNKMICAWDGEGREEACDTLTFDRKCEWSKHMDKHDRPYRCPHLQCEKLQGFTYSGGLLRHEREVHGKHGGPKEQLMCPFPDCKRANGKGFTRKENLNEHIRRVHQNKEIPPPTSATSNINPALDTTSGAEQQQQQQDDTPASKFSETLEQALEPALSAKRRRVDSDGNVDGGCDDPEYLRKENEELKAQNGRYYARIQELEARNQEQENRLHMLEDSLRQYQSQQPPQQQQQHQMHMPAPEVVMSETQFLAQQMTEQLQQHGMGQEDMGMQQEMPMSQDIGDEKAV